MQFCSLNTAIYGTYMLLFLSAVAMNNESASGAELLGASDSQAEARGQVVDAKAFIGMPEDYAKRSSEYVLAVLEAMGARPASRKVYRNEQKDGEASYPLDSNPVHAGEKTVEIILLPRHTAVYAWSQTAKAKEAGWRTVSSPFDRNQTLIGRTALFQRGEDSQNPRVTPAMPFETSVSEGIFAYGDLFLEIGKVVESPYFDVDGQPEDKLSSLKFNETGGAKWLGDFLTMPAYRENPRLWWTSIRVEDNGSTSLAYALVDGNGARREEPAEGVSPWVRPLTCKQHQPKTGQHDNLLLPVPLKWGNGHSGPHESWVMDEWFSRQPQGCWTIREGRDSQPLTESFLLEPASRENKQPLHAVVIFADTPVKRLIEELSQVSELRADSGVMDEVLKRLEQSYSRLRNHPLD
jgi:hypothetical protein